MLKNDALKADILSNAEPDCWNKEWSQTGPQWGGGMAVELEVGELLHSLVRAIRPENVVETGTHKGFSTIMIAQALEENGHGHLHTMDVSDLGVGALSKRYGLGGRVTFIQGDSRKELVTLAKRLGRFPFLWLDADHSETFVLAEMEAAGSALQPGCYVAFHDTLTDKREAAAVAEVKRRHPSWGHIHFATARGFDLMKVE